MERKELLKGLTAEQIEKVKNCKSNEELLELAKKEGFELSDEQLAAVTGGGCVDEAPDLGVCPACGSDNIQYTVHEEFSLTTYYCECHNCYHRWEVKK